jgi:SRSO17 transposase
MPHLGDPTGVLVRDETGVLNKGERSAGVARQDRGTAGTVEHCQLGVLRRDARPLGQVLLDRQRYVPQAWRADGARCRQAGIPADRPLATTPQLACQLLARACAAGVPTQWVTGDRVEGDDRRLRRWREGRPPPDVRAVSGQD